MRKSNWFVFTLALIAALILFVCYLLVGCHLDPPLLIIWLVLLLIGAIVITALEKKRRNLLRMVYVAAPAGFNTSTGPLTFDSAQELVGKARQILTGIDYDSEPRHAPDSFNPSLKVVTDKFDDGVWTGKVVEIETDEQAEFSTSGQLERIISKYL